MTLLMLTLDNFTTFARSTAFEHKRARPLSAIINQLRTVETKVLL